MRLAAIGIVVLSLALVGLGCGSEDGSDQGRSFEAQQAREAAQDRRQRQLARQRRRAAQRRARHRAQVVAARRQQAREQREAEAQEAAEAARIEEEEAEEAEETSECDPNYSGACLDPYAYDYDCEGGSGDGPEYTGTVSVVGEDHFDLDRNSNGVGCEPE